MKRIAALSIILAFSFLNCKAIKPQTLIVITLSGGKQKTTIIAHKGDTLLVKLPMISGTGYVWEVSGEPNFCKQGDIKYEHVKKRTPGASLVEVINFNVKASGVEDISFIYHRPFEKDKAPAETKTLHLIVR